LTNIFGKCRIKSTSTIAENGTEKEREKYMKRLPDSELELMMIIWDAGGAITRPEIEERLPKERRLSPTTILSFLTRLQEKGFVQVRKEGKTNVYEPLIPKEAYVREESKSIWKRLYQGSMKNFVAGFCESDGLTEEDFQELQDFLDKRRGKN